ncbi:hypothetical protein CXZ10_06985 [Pleomorphomonas diazotrophica]|uniref:Amidase domain-containing protein n=1 Tax=Pleomorphomonas diazotrophica TaxID=1166257 RepID=A0A1I4S6B7_9HYPH|nr:amidase family protein [Pleomorphomonas diazotrophica]PKR89917.1 hypothetical protein CXZ10_06985 [Pleomorphomonas diazotrophica]SFM59999.1 allophanate hydrolase [Pleomorphomonas diazotrophica]
MRAPVLKFGGLGECFAGCPESILDVADDIARRFAASDGVGSPAPLGAAARDLLARCPDPSALPLWGIPYVVDANIDVAGLPTSIGLPALDFQPDFDAVVIERLQAAGALLVGKVPIGLLGLDAPAAGIGETIAAGLAAFGIAGERTGAASCGMVEIRPSPGLVSVEGLFAIAPELDGVVIHAADVACGSSVRRVIESVPVNGRSVALPSRQLGVLGGSGLAAAEDLAERLGLATIALSEAPFDELRALMDDDIWLALRLEDVAIAFTELPDLFPLRLRRRLSDALGRPARQLACAQRRLSELRRQVEAELSDVDLLVVPPEFGSASFVSACGLAAITLPDGSSLIGAGGNDETLAVAAATLTDSPLPRSTRPIDIQASSPLAHR